jgi:uncharacterized membrane protein
MENSKEQKTYQRITADRQKALADGVFAIVMTLLVLELAIPEIHGSSNHELTQALGSMWPKFVAYTLSFFVLGVFWLIHHILFDTITYYDSRLAWLNILFLLFVALVPFTTSLLGEYLLEKTPTVLYGIQLLVLFLLGFSLWTYATGRRLTENNIDHSLVKSGQRMGYVYFLILITAIIFAFFIPLVSIIIYGVFVLLFIIVTGFGRAEYAVSLRVKDEDVQGG